MDDRELLELAAKAARIKITGWGKPDYYSHQEGEVAYVGGFEWNPLTDDGDALRLVIDLLLAAWTYDEEVEIGVPGGNQGLRILEPYNGDPYAATCRAIVRAAAEIGRAMK